MEYKKSRESAFVLQNAKDVRSALCEFSVVNVFNRRKRIRLGLTFYKKMLYWRHGRAAAVRGNALECQPVTKVENLT